MTEEEKYSGVIAGLFLFAKLQNDIMWKEFATSLIFENRFTSNHEILNTIKDNIDICTNNIPKDSKFFRARIYPEEQFLTRIKDILIKGLD